MKQLINNRTSINAIDVFNKVYGPKALVICPELEDIRINAVIPNESLHIAECNLNESDAFAYYFNYKALPKYAEIIMIENVCKILNMFNEDIFAAIAHELGHIISIEIHGDCYKDLAAEVLSDDYTCKLGLRAQLIILLEKMRDSGLYNDFQYSFLEKRIELLEKFPVENDISTFAKMALIIENNKI